MITLVQSYFRDFPAESKLWIFMADRKLEEVESQVLTFHMDQFMPQWNAHGSEIKAGYEIIHHQFLVVVADESSVTASGCSIDSLTRFVKMIEEKIGISLILQAKT